MKNKFDMHPTIARMLETAGFDYDRITNAVQSAKNDGSLLNQPDETAKDSGVKAASKGTEAKWNVTSRAEYGAKMNDPLRFAAWNDSLTAHFKKCGDPHAELTEALIPASLYLWVTKFKVNKAQPAEVAPVSSNGNGKHRKGNIEKVPTVS